MQASDEDIDNQFLTKLATNMVALSWRNLVTALSMGDITAIKRNFRLFVGSSGDTELIRSVNKWLFEVDREYDILNCHRDTTQVGTESTKKSINEKLVELYMDIHDKLMPMMRERKYIVFDNFRAKPKVQGISKL